MTETLALFDLDNTLLPIDSDYEWGQFIVRIGAVDKDTYEAKNKMFFEQYIAGTLDAAEYLAFALGELKGIPRAKLDAWHQQFMAEVIIPNIKPAAVNLVKNHLDKGHLTAIVTATNRFVTAPIAKAFGVKHLIAAIPEETPDGMLTGGLVGTPTSGKGKIEHTEKWLASLGLSFEQFTNSYFYSDSDRDIPLLSKVKHPVAANPNERLKAYALANGWDLLYLFDD